MQRSLLNFFTRAPCAKVKTMTSCNEDEPTSRSVTFPVDLNDDEALRLPLRRKRPILDSSDEENLSDPVSITEEGNGSVDTSVKLSNFTRSPSRKSLHHHFKSIENVTHNAHQQPIMTSESSRSHLSAAAETDPMTWEHLSMSFLQPDRLRDSANRRPDHPDYDKSTLNVPIDFLSKQTPAMRQWWELKSRYADVIIFFKMGKFYEMYHMDAVIGVEHLGLVYMKGTYAHCGFPEVAFSRNAEVLVRKGYKVGRVEQTESVDAMTERARGLRGSEKVVRRELCQLLTPGTYAVDLRCEISGSQTCSLGDAESVARTERLESADSILIAIVQRNTLKHCENFAFGVAILNASSGKIQIGQFTDDRHCSRLRTVIAQNFPSQVLVERGFTGPAVKRLLSTVFSGVPVEYLVSDKQFWLAKQTIAELEAANYFTASQLKVTDKSHMRFPGKEHWPEAILTTLDEDDHLGRSVKPDYDLAVCCLGAVVFYLRYCLVDREVLSLGYIELYQPPDAFRDALDSQSDSTQKFYSKQTSMILDSVTLANLDILCNNSTGTRDGTLIERLDTCCTSFGRRLLRQWITAPLCNPVTIRRRQDAVDSLMDNYDKLPQVKEYLRRLPDFERLLAKIHLIGSRGKDKNHPDSRAVVYEEVQYSRRSIIDFVATLNGFELAYEMIGYLNNLNFSSIYLKNLLRQTDSGGQFPSLSSRISFFKNAFDAEKAKRDGRIVPEHGVDDAYDFALKEIEEINDELEAYLLNSSKRLGSRLTYWGTGRNRFQIEVPDSCTSRVPCDWQLASQRKGVKRYRNSETQDLLNRLMVAEEKKDISLRQIMHNLFSSFSEHFTHWHAAMRAIAELDCLIALCTYSLNASDVMCRPVLVDMAHGDEEPFLEIIDGRHPCLINAFTANDLIPNDIRLGRIGQTNFPRTLLVTGPNMGGKSTLMRQTALLVILAHLGCRIPARFCRLSPVDRVFSRLGATDRLLAGESTFMVELSETAAILRHISPHSLVLMDELGRGTSTHDGAALASSVLHFLSNPVFGSVNTAGPRTLFSTHYHNLVDEVAASKKSSSVALGLGHMACMLEEQSEAQPGLENITFLYKFVEGVCPKSYGFNAARLAHLPDEVIQVGLAKAKEFERTMATFSCLRKLLSASADPSDLQDWLGKLQSF